MEKFSCRLADLNDAEGIARVHVETWQSAYRGQLPDVYLDGLLVEERAKVWKVRLGETAERARVLVAESDNGVVGFCTVGSCRDRGMPEDTGELYAIYVDGASTGKGVGSQLMESGLNFLREQGFTTATLWVLTSNEKTRKWYESRGWKEEGKTKVDKRDGFEMHETRYMTDL